MLRACRTNSLVLLHSLRRKVRHINHLSGCFHNIFSNAWFEEQIKIYLVSSFAPLLGSYLIRRLLFCFAESDQLYHITSIYESVFSERTVSSLSRSKCVCFFSNRLYYKDIKDFLDAFSGTLKTPLVYNYP